MPFDDSALLSNKETYDIPYGQHSKDRAETLSVSVNIVEGCCMFRLVLYCCQTGFTKKRFIV